MTEQHHGEEAAATPRAHPIELPPSTEHKSLEGKLRRLLLAGILVLVPVALTVYVLQWLFQTIDGMLPVLADQLGFDRIGLKVPDFPGLGLLLTLLAILVLGWLSTNVLGRRLIHTGERMLSRIPIGRSIYSATKSMLEILSQSQTDAFKRVVLIEYPRRGIYALAFITGVVRWPQIGEDLGDAMMVFLPTTPNPTSGFLLVIPREQVIDIPLSVEEGMRLVISGGILSAQISGLLDSDPNPASVPPASP